MFKAILIVLSLGFSAIADVPSVHGMLLFGTKKVFVSHLPMFHSPHDYQWIASLNLPEETEAVYLQDKEETGSVVYTLVPERFELPSMVASPRPFKAVLYRGHFERGGVPITGTITVQLEQTIHFAKLNPNEMKPATFIGLAVGDEEEMFIAHKISGRPDFDQIVEIEPSKMSQFLSSSLPNSPLKEVKKVLYTEFGDLE
jgi:hypothetical protein